MFLINNKLYFIIVKSSSFDISGKGLFFCLFLNIPPNIKIILKIFDNINLYSTFVEQNNKL